MSLLVGIAVCNTRVGDVVAHSTPARYADAVLGGVGAVPVLLPPEGEAMLAVLDRLDGLLLSGSPSNVEPDRYGGGESLTPGRHDPARDATTLPMIRAALARHLPLLAICRGTQELNVALGGTLIQQVQTLPGHLDHRGAPGGPEFRYKPRHPVSLSGDLARLLGKSETIVNSSHEQAIDRPGDGAEVVARAEDGTIEAIRVAGPSFALGLQWHPEWRFEQNPDSRAIFAAFGSACRAYAGCRAAA